MKAPRNQLAMTAVVAIVLAATMLAAPAGADRGHGKGHGRSKHRYKYVERVVVAPRPHHVVYVQPHVYPAPPYSSFVLSGVIGGVQLSARFGDTPHYGYGFWDPYCDVRFTSMRAYRHHCGAHGHPYQLSVFAVAPGHSCDRYCDHGCDDGGYHDEYWDR